MQQNINIRNHKTIQSAKNKITQRDALRIVKNFAKEIINSGVELKKVFLFGSFARNEQQRWSDIDVALVSDSFTGFGFKDLELLGEICVKRDYTPIQTKFYSTLYFKKGDPFIKEEIVRSGIEIKF